MMLNQNINISHNLQNEIWTKTALQIQWDIVHSHSSIVMQEVMETIWYQIKGFIENKINEEIFFNET